MLGIRDDALLKAAGVRKGYAPMKVLLFSLSSLQLFFFNITWHLFKTHTQRPQNLEHVMGIIARAHTRKKKCWLSTRNGEMMI